MKLTSFSCQRYHKDTIHITILEKKMFTNEMLDQRVNF